jgi:hypothetical protein
VLQARRDEAAAFKARADAVVAVARTQQDVERAERAVREAAAELKVWWVAWGNGKPCMQLDQLVHDQVRRPQTCRPASHQPLIKAQPRAKLGRSEARNRARVCCVGTPRHPPPPPAPARRRPCTPRTRRGRTWTQWIRRTWPGTTACTSRVRRAHPGIRTRCQGAGRGKGRRRRPKNGSQRYCNDWGEAQPEAGTAQF